VEVILRLRSILLSTINLSFDLRDDSNTTGVLSAQNTVPGQRKECIKPFIFNASYRNLATKNCAWRENAD
jgi:hypothetical protein